MTTNPEADKNTITFGERLRALLAEQGKSQAQLGRDTSIDRSEINRLCKGKRDPRPHEVIKIARALGIEPAQLLDGVRLPKEFEAVRAELERIAAELLRNQQERDEARAKLEAERAQIEAERQAWAEERAALDRRLAAAEKAHADEVDSLRRSAEEAARKQLDELNAERQKAGAQLSARRHAASAREQQLVAELRLAREAQKAESRRLAQAAALNTQLRTTNQALQGEISSLKGQRIITGVLGALGGMMLTGGGIDDYYEDA